MFFMSPANKFKEDAGDKLTVYHPYPRKPFVDIITKAALSPQLFEDPKCWSSLRLEPLTP